MSYAAAATMFGLGQLPEGAIPIAGRSQLADRGFEVTGRPPGAATHFTLEPIEGGVSLVYYDASGNEIEGRIDQFWRTAVAPPGAAPTEEPGVISTVKSWFRPKTAAPKGAPSGAPLPGALAPSPYPFPPAALPVPEWVAPVAIAAVVLAAAGGLYWASTQQRRTPRVATNRRRRKRRPRRRARR